MPIVFSVVSPNQSHYAHPHPMPTYVTSIQWFHPCHSSNMLHTPCYQSQLISICIVPEFGWILQGCLHMVDSPLSHCL